MSDWSSEFESALSEIKALERGDPSAGPAKTVELKLARPIYERLRESAKKCEDSGLRSALGFYCEVRYACNLFHSDENSEAQASFAKAKILFSEIESPERRTQFEPFLLKVANCLGYVEISLGDRQKGLATLLEAEELAEKLRGELPGLGKDKETETGKILEGKETEDSSKKDEKERTKLSFEERVRAKRARRIRKLSTITSFYLSQTYGKLGDSDLSISHCEKTLARQFESLTFHGVPVTDEDVISRCLALGKYYGGELRTRKALFLLESGLIFLEERARAGRGALLAAKGEVLVELFERALEHLLETGKNDGKQEGKAGDSWTLPADLSSVNEAPPSILFDRPASSPNEDLSSLSSYETMKPIFARAIAAFSEARGLFEPDFRNEAAEVCKAMASLYSDILSAESPGPRIDAIQSRKLTLLENAIELTENPTTKLELQALLGEAELAELDSLQRSAGSVKPERALKHAQKIAKAARAAASTWSSVVQYFDEHPPADPENLASLVTALLSRGRALALAPAEHPAENLSRLKESFGSYERAESRILEFKKSNQLDSTLEKQLQIASEYKKMLGIRLAAITGN